MRRKSERVMGAFDMWHVSEHGGKNPEAHERVAKNFDMWYVSEHGGKSLGTRYMGERVTEVFDMYVIGHEGKNPET
jgi:hypothetical protein